MVLHQPFGLTLALSSSILACHRRALLFKHRGRLPPLLASLRAIVALSYSSVAGAFRPFYLLVCHHGARIQASRPPFRLLQLLARCRALHLSIDSSCRRAPHQFYSSCADGRHPIAIQASRQQAPRQFHPSAAALTGPINLLHNCAIMHPMI